MCRGGGVRARVGVGRKGGTTVKNVNLLITEYIAVHLKCCCYANTLGVYFLNPREELSVRCSPAVSFEFAAAIAAIAVSVLKSVGGVCGGRGERVEGSWAEPPKQSYAKQQEAFLRTT